MRLSEANRGDKRRQRPMRLGQHASTSLAAVRKSNEDPLSRLLYAWPRFGLNPFSYEREGGFARRPVVNWAENSGLANDGRRSQACLRQNAGEGRWMMEGGEFDDAWGCGGEGLVRGAFTCDCQTGDVGGMGRATAMSGCYGEHRQSRNKIPRAEWKHSLTIED
ncbi:hypothetical protein LIA77_10522 [Sarocladium implicatum]|nr:hypothetical protein LIA77_10522 [Sarocladium implicatum]